MIWPKKKLIEVATLQRGYDLPIQNRSDGDIPIYAANGLVGFHNVKGVNGPGVITGRSGSIGKVHFTASDYWPLNTSLFVKDFHGNDPKFVYWLLKSLNLENYHEGSSVPTLNRNVIHEIKVSTPPLSEQRRIAAILDKAEALRANRREAITKLDQLLQSVFIDMFGDPVKNEKNWQKNNILEYCDFLTGYPFKSANFVGKNSGIKICRGANVLPGYIDWSDEVNYPSECFEELNNFQLFDGDVVVAMDRPWISSGFKAVLLREINEKILLVQRVARLRAKQKHYSSFVYKLICSQAFIQQCKPTETTVPHISPNDFRNFNIISPPEELIKKFHVFSEEIFSMKQKSENSLKKLDHFSASLQNNFFN